MCAPVPTVRYPNAPDRPTQTSLTSLHGLRDFACLPGCLPTPAHTLVGKDVRLNKNTRHSMLENCELLLLLLLVLLASPEGWFPLQTHPHAGIPSPTPTGPVASY